jgi:phthalate 4,5-dioxygenase oxygenase subunit
VDGTVPPGVDDAAIFWKARAGSFYADDKIDWLDAYQEQLKAALACSWPASRGVGRWPRTIG